MLRRAFAGNFQHLRRIAKYEPSVPTRAIVFAVVAQLKSDPVTATTRAAQQYRKSTALGHFLQAVVACGHSYSRRSCVTYQMGQRAAIIPNCQSAYSAFNVLATGHALAFDSKTRQQTTDNICQQTVINDERISLRPDETTCLSAGTAPAHDSQQLLPGPTV
ncbi:hypothetical protein CB0940_06762 [Cercospora beticola]|uniref:Uncharacterized protein n=1 Tax=Cercospora beticola TaxID=122368 RepID=A0A2G5H875_CERBT|nr:hypothetical protein CB0940_06762 [Cercospora beticola]PIA88729.1 hypothetical protein CB0940_06762 [Cercospora beticola]